ncbi:hypothetical protein GIB67_011911 [Kingdonia uniflora]|uniref:Uncharacterized protein n=1 Tax=Kingdonia uniflora TaxID=39325 RepID=A0A7J7LZR5_9MAGN|nr:hypothetical protein GIB67_011911 [Kingdonia uniflora]
MNEFPRLSGRPGSTRASRPIGSYELMEHMLKVYIYEEGEKPVFHQPPLKGIYVSEGWFMKLMEGNNQFVVKDPREVHLFYLSFCSQMLRLTLYDPLNKAKLAEHLKSCGYNCFKISFPEQS